METAKLTVIVTPEHKIPLRDVTPAEALMLKALHFQGSNGTPLEGIEVDGEAVTVDRPARSGQPEYYDPNKGRTIPAVEPVAAVTHKRTNAEEITRLKRKYTAIVNGVSAFESVFGKASIINLPKTFAEIQEELGAPVAAKVSVAQEAQSETPVEQPAHTTKRSKS